jgi:hypothetical protein
MGLGKKGLELSWAGGSTQAEAGVAGEGGGGDSLPVGAATACELAQIYADAAEPSGFGDSGSWAQS